MSDVYDLIIIGGVFALMITGPFFVLTGEL